MNPESHFRAVAPLHMRQLLKDFPELTPLDAAAVFGNAGYESRGLTDDQEDKPLVKGSRGGRNWMQWTGPRRVALEAYCQRNNIDPDSDTAAYKWLFLELKGEEQGALKALNGASTLEDKVKAFERSYLRAAPKTVNYPERIRWAKIALEEISRPAAREEPPVPMPRPEFPQQPAPEPRTGKGWGISDWAIFFMIVALALLIAAFTIRF